MSYKLMIMAVVVQICAIVSFGAYQQQLVKKDKMVDQVSVSMENVTWSILVTEMISYHMSAKHEGNYHDCKRCKQIVKDKEKETLSYYEDNK